MSGGPATGRLFPYTTLFRSLLFVGAAALRRGALSLGDLIVFAGLLQQFSGQITNLDRKSTRLNSSHLENSYAVFCLKKENAAQLWIISRLLETYRGNKNTLW